MTASANLSSPHRWSRATGRLPPRMEGEEAHRRGLPAPGCQGARRNQTPRLRQSPVPAAEAWRQDLAPSPDNLIPIPEPQIHCVDSPCSGPL